MRNSNWLASSLERLSAMAANSALALAQVWRTRAVDTCMSPSGEAQKSAMASPTIMPDDHGFGHRVAAQPVEAVQIPARRLAAGEQAAQAVSLAVGVGADAAHRVMLGWAHRYPLLPRVDAEEIMADFLHLAQLVFDVRGAEQGDVQPQVLAVARGDALAAADVGFHAPRHHVARGESFFSGS